MQLQVARQYVKWFILNYCLKEITWNPLTLVSLLNCSCGKLLLFAIISISQVEGMSMFWNYISINLIKINKQKLSNNIFDTFRLVLFHFYNKLPVVGKLKINSFQ